MKTNLLIIGIILGLMIFCSKDNDLPGKKNYAINGVAQKGPFIHGSQIDISELDDLLNQTGINFKTEIKNNLGEFELTEISLVSSKIELTADGYYFNEIEGLLSPSRLVLKSLSDLTDTSNTNINILTHITVDRIRALFNEGEDFKTAKEKAQNEILTLFYIDSIYVGSFNELDISNQEEKGAVLIAISSIFQGRNTVAELSKLLADFIEDFGIDGMIDNTSVQAELINNAYLIDPVTLRKNLEKHYSSLGLDLYAPNFEKYLLTYIDSTDSESTIEMTYPLTGSYGENILAMENEQVIDENVEYNVTAKFPSDLDLLIRLKINVMEGNVTWVVDSSKQENWFGILNNGDEIRGQILGGMADMSIVFTGTGIIEVQVETFKADIVDEYLGTKLSFLTIK